MGPAKTPERNLCTINKNYGRVSGTCARAAPARRCRAGGRWRAGGRGRRGAWASPGRGAYAWLSAALARNARIERAKNPPKTENVRMK
jgi:hypothetical protein